MNQKPFHEFYLGDYPCVKCGAWDQVQEPREFKNKSIHIEAKCAKCKKHIQFVKQTEFGSDWASDKPITLWE